MMFEEDGFYKHDNCKDVFICVFSDSLWGIRGVWMVQGTESHWMASAGPEIINIKTEDRKKWRRYVPQGNYRIA